VTTAQRARLVLALGVMNLVLAVAALAIGGFSSQVPGSAAGASGVAIAPSTAPGQSATGSGPPGTSPGTPATASPPASVGPRTSPQTEEPSPSATPTEAPGPSATPEPGAVGPPAIGQTPAPGAVPTVAPAPRPTTRPTPRPTTKPTPAPTAPPAIVRPRPPCPGVATAPPGHNKVLNPSRPCGHHRPPRRHGPSQVGTAGASTGWAWLIVFALPVAGIRTRLRPGRGPVDATERRAGAPPARP